MVSFQSLGNPEARAFQLLLTLEFNQVNVLIDAGWDELLRERAFDKLVEAMPKIELILLTHPTIGHVGAFCYLRNKYPQFRAIPAYATLPVIRMGQMMTLDVYRSAGICGPFDNPDALDEGDVDVLWSEVHPLKYSQPLQLRNHPHLEGIEITAYNSGHSLGGTLWKISDGVDAAVIALDWNHARDAHLSGAFLEPMSGTVVRAMQKPTLLITSTDVASGLPLTKARQQLLDSVDRALQMGGTVLIPTSSGSRLLELILILDKFVSSTHKRVPLIYCSYYGKQALSQASSMLEWMVPSIISDWQVQNESPFDTGHIRHVSSMKQLRDRYARGPKIVLAAGECLESGISKEVFLEMVAEDPTSAVILTELCPPGTLGAELSKLSKPPSLSQLTTTLPDVGFDRELPLTGEALAAYNKRKEAEREQVEAKFAQERRNQELIDTSAAAQEESSDDDDEYEDFNPETIGANVLLYGNNVYDYKCNENAGVQMFPFTPKRLKVDEYGEYLPPQMFQSLAESTTHKDDKQEGDVKAAKSQEAKKVQATQRRPVKLEAINKNVKALCWVAQADMNGLTNMRSLEMILKQIQPARVIAIPGSPQVCDQLKKQCPQFAVGDHEVYFERTNFAVDVRLDPSVPLEWHDLFSGHTIARVAGTLEFDPHDKIQRAGATLVLSRDSLKPATTTVGDLRLTALRKLLSEKGLKTEFRSQGVLVCNDNIVVRKEENGRFRLEGGLYPEYYVVRDAVRQFFAKI